jgi:hypothetical protein
MRLCCLLLEIPDKSGLLIGDHKEISVARFGAEIVLFWEYFGNSLTRGCLFLISWQPQKILQIASSAY